MQANLKGLVEIDLKIMTARVNGLSLFEYNKDDLYEVFNSILLEIAAITGIRIPFDAVFIEVIRNKAVDFLLDFGYEELNTEEIILAFQLNSKINMKYPIGIEIEYVELFGDCISVDYISKVLFNYMTIRNLLDRKLQNIIDGY